MKKTLTILAIVCILVASISFSAFALTQDEGGVYQIATAEDLIEFRNTAQNHDKAVLTADIDMTGKEWTPFDNISISIDGQGHTIDGLSYTKDGGGNVGLLVNTLGHGNQKHEIQNIKFTDCNLTVLNASGGTCVGLVAGYTDRTTAMGITLENCVISVSHSGDAEVAVGGIIGRADWGYDNNEIPVSATVNEDCIIIVEAERTPYVGGIVGAHNGDTLRIKDSVMNGTIESSSKAAFVFQLWGAAILDGCTNGTDYVLTLTPGNLKSVVTVGTAEELNAVAAAINDGQIGYADITLTADIDFTGKTWTPIGGDYKGVFDGQGHTVSGITLEYNDVTGGRFGILVNFATNGPNGTVKNITLKDCSITVNMTDSATDFVYVGGVIGAYNRGHIENITLNNVDVKVTGKTSGECGVGGVAGKAEWAGPRGTVGFYNVSVDKDSSVVADTTDTTARAGGIVGMAGSSDRYEFDNCVNYASVTSGHTAAGILGSSGHWNNPANVIKNSKNYGNVYGAEISASIVGPCDGASLTLENVVAGGFITGGNEVFGTCRTEATKTNVKEVSIIDPLNKDSEKDLVSYFQTATASETTINLRVLFLAKLEYVTEVDALTINITFTKGDATVKQYNGALGNTVYKSVSAAGDVYVAPENIIMFGNIITGIPTADVDGFTVTVTDGAGNTVYTGSASLA